MNYEIADGVRNKRPLIHCITNYVTANDVANMILAAGGSPIMAEAVSEAKEITRICGGLVLNMGMLSDQKLEAMILAGREAALLGHPVVLDPVGVGSSSFREKGAERILREVPCTVIRGNRSEILRIGELTRHMASGGRREFGVDTAPGPEKEEESEGARLQFYRDLSRLSDKTGAVIVMTGETDLVADGRNIYRIRNGHPMMSRITGAGCMLDGVIGAYTAAWKQEAIQPQERRVCGSQDIQPQERRVCGSQDSRPQERRVCGSQDSRPQERRACGSQDIQPQERCVCGSQAGRPREHCVCGSQGSLTQDGGSRENQDERQDMAKAAALAAAALGLCGQLAYRKAEERQEGTGSFRTYLLDYMSRIDSKQLRGGADIEIQTIISDRVRGD